MLVDITDSWAPTPENIKALPRPVRSYIYDIEMIDGVCGHRQPDARKLQASTGECSATYGVRKAGEFISACLTTALSRLNRNRNQVGGLTF